MSYKNYEDPVRLSCFKLCTACYRCADKGCMTKCNSCSGRPDPTKKKEPHDIDDRCRCKEGILQARHRNGSLIQLQYPRDPFAGKIEQREVSEDERDWEAYVNQQRERLDDPNFDPIQFS